MAESVTASRIDSETAQFSSDAVTIRAFLARPAQPSGLLPTVVVLHEWWGLNDQIKEVARRCAQEGFAAFAPDLYSRLGHKVARTPQEATALMSALSSQAVLRDLNAATTHLKTQPFIDPMGIGMLGFSMGGTFALTQAAHNSDLKAVVAFYGKVPPIETLNYLLCPLLYHCAAKDGWVTRQEVDRLTQGCEQYGKSGIVHVYPEADHSFFNETRPEVYRAQDAKLAWERTIRFLASRLKGMT
jgi:carboxymethylenebutenolidase